MMALLKFSEVKFGGLVWNSLTSTGSIEQYDLDEPLITNNNYLDSNGIHVHFYYNPISKVASITYTRDIGDSTVLRVNFSMTTAYIHSVVSFRGPRNISFEETSKFINDVENCKLQPRTIQFFLQWAGNNEVIG